VKQKSYLIAALSTLFFIIIIQSVYGNPVPLGPIESPFIRVPLLIIMFFIGAKVEYAYFNAKFFRKYRYNPNTNKFDVKSHYNLFLRVNLVTYPLTQILAYFFYIYFLFFFFFYIILIEIGVIFIESHLLRIELQRLLDVELSPKFILSKTCSANIASFFVGLLVFMPIIF
jgi:hypothetical protein